MDTYTIPVGVTSLIAGLYLAFFGFYFIKITIFLICALTFTVIAFSEIKSVVGENSEQWIFWVTGIGAIMLGLCFGVCLSQCPVVPVLAGGATIGSMIANLIELDGAFYWICIAIVAVLSAVAYLFFKEITLILCTGLLGSYLSIRGVMVLVVGYPDPFAPEKGDQSPVLFWGTAAGFVILTGLAVLYQYSSTYKGNSKHESN